MQKTFMRLRFYGALLFLTTNTLLAGTIQQKDDSYDSLTLKIELYEGNPKVWVYLNKYLEKAKKEKDWPEAVTAYKEMMHECEESLRITYADSMVTAAIKSGDKDLIGSSYLSKGIVYYQKKQHHRALDNYVLANKFLVGTKDRYLLHKVKYSIAQIKYYLGYYHEAMSLFSDCQKYYQDKEVIPYLYSLHSLALCNIYTGNLAKAAQSNEFSLSESLRLNNKVLLPYIEMAEGIINYKEAKYGIAIRNISYALEGMDKKKDFANEAVANFFLGKSYWALGQQQKAIQHFIKVDKAFTNHDYIRPDLRESYEYLIPYFQKKGELQAELTYINRLLKADKVLNSRFSYLVKKIHKEYDTRELIAQKQKIEDDLKQSEGFSWLYKFMALALALALLFFLNRHQHLKKRYKQSFESLMQNNTDNADDGKEAKPQVLDINPAIVEMIATKLEEFESKAAFLKKDINAIRLAESFETNSKYLSMVIRHYREKSFVNYINDLRIDYLIERLKVEPMLRRYNNSALASEAGFSTAQHFTTAFKKRTGISPGYFVEEFEKIEHVGKASGSD